MNNPLASIVCLVFVALAVWHFVMALRPSMAGSSAVPSVDGMALFKPSRVATVGVGIALIIFAALVADAGGLLALGLPMVARQWIMYLLALGLLARAVGEFRYVGFFKRVRGSRFARLDDFFYSPLCLLLAAGVAWVGHEVPLATPPWVKLKIAEFQQLPPFSPPRSIVRTTWDGKTVYYVSRACCDIPSELYDESGTLLCHPDGGFAGGDGKCNGFKLEGNEGSPIWRDGRGPAAPAK